jgi:hypothetical protein
MGTNVKCVSDHLQKMHHSEDASWMPILGTESVFQGYVSAVVMAGVELKCKGGKCGRLGNPELLIRRCHILRLVGEWPIGGQG